MGSPKKKKKSFKKSVSGTFLYVVGVIRFYCFLEGSKERKLNYTQYKIGVF